MIPGNNPNSKSVFHPEKQPSSLSPFAGLFQVLSRVAKVMIVVRVMKLCEDYENIWIFMNFVLNVNVVLYGNSNAKSWSVQTVFWHTHKKTQNKTNNPPPPPPPPPHTHTHTHTQKKQLLKTHVPVTSLVIRDAGHSWLRLKGCCLVFTGPFNYMNHY